MDNLYHSSSYDPQLSDFGDESSFLVPWYSLPSHDHFSSTTSSTTSCSSAFHFCGFPSISMPNEGFSEDKVTAASRSHSQAEKRRRDRINAQLSILRKLIPKSDKMDKAALLGSVIDDLKDLKRKTVEIEKSLIVPTEVDEITIDSDLSDQDMSLITNNMGKISDNIYYIKASLCCDDRPELFSELIKVLNALRLTAVRADIASIGGRIKSVLLLCSKGSDQDQGVCINTLRQSLKSVLSKIASQSMASNFRVRSKRQRFFLPSHCSNHNQ